MASALEHLGASLARLEPQDIAASTREKLRLHVADTIAAWIAASRTPEGRALFALRRRRDGPPVHDDVATHCALVRLSEVDDIHLASMTTPASIVIPAALTIARGLSDPADVSMAIVAGYEAMIRLGLAIDGPAVLYRGIWPTYFTAPFGVAAVAAHLLRLDAGETAHALALALTLAAPGVGHHNAPTTSRWLAVGNAARSGLTAALAAQAGFTADLNLVESGFFANVYGITPRATALTDVIGAVPALAQVSFKPWCAARQTMAATQALREVMQQGVQPDDIIAVRAAVLPPHLKMIDHSIRAGDRASHLTSLPYQMAVAALDPAAALGLSPREPAPSLQAFMARVAVEPDDALLRDYPSAWPARVSVATRSGTREQSLMHVPGDPARPFAEPDLADKFHRLVAPILGEEKSRALMARSVAGLTGAELATMVDEVERICTAAEA